MNYMRGNFFYRRLGNRVAYERKRHSLSQETLSLITDIDRTYIVKIEKGKANPSIKVIRKIARVFKMKVSDLLEGV